MQGSGDRRRKEVHSHRPNASSGPQGWHIRRIGGVRLEEGGTIDQEKTRAVSQVELADEPIYAASSSDGTRLWGRGTKPALLSSRDIHLENAYGSPTHRVRSDGAAGMVDELWKRARVCGRSRSCRRRPNISQRGVVAHPINANDSPAVIFLVVPPRGATTACALALVCSSFVRLHPSDITVGFSHPGMCRNHQHPPVGTPRSRLSTGVWWAMMAMGEK